MQITTYFKTPKEESQLMFTILTLSIWMSLFCTNSWSKASAKIDVDSKEIHSVRLLEDGIAGLEARLELIQNAKDYIDVETFIFERGYSSRLFMHELVVKKRENPKLRVRILVDATPNHKLFDYLDWMELSQNGIEFKLYNLAGFPNLNTRNHRKMMVSEREAIIGGRNLSDEYFTFSRLFNFYDRDILIRGPIVTTMAGSFEDFWQSPKSEIPIPIEYPNMEYFRSEPNRSSSNQSFPTAGDSATDIYKYNNSVAAYKSKKNLAKVFISDDLQNIENKMLETVHAAGHRALEKQPWFQVSDIRFVSDGPDWDNPTATVTGPAILDIMEKAEVKMTIENGYIIPDMKGWEIFLKYLRAGKKLNIFTNSRKAAQKEFLVNSMTLDHTTILAALGADVYLATGGVPVDIEIPFPELTKGSIFSTHAKSLVVDDRICVIGSANFDPRSQKRMNSEMALIISDSAFCIQLEDRIEQRARQGVELSGTGDTKGKFDLNRAESIGQQLILFLLPMIQIFEDWF